MKSSGTKFKVSFTFASMIALMAVSFVALVANAQAPGQENGAAESAGSGEAQREQQSRGAEAGPTSSPANAAPAERAQDAPRPALPPRAQERIENLAANMSNRMDAVAGRFDGIIARIHSRMEKLENSGVDVSDATPLITAAETSLEKAQAELMNIDTRVAAVVSSETPREAWQRAKAAYSGIKEHLRATHASLRATVSELKAAVSEASLNGGVSEAVRSDSGTSTGTSSSATTTATTSETE